MTHIPTTVTAAEKLKRRAKALRKDTGTSLAVAQDAVARQDGYRSWKHVTVCVVQTKALAPTLPALPKLLGDTLAFEARREPPHAPSVQAFGSGLVFAMDVKDADGLFLGDHVVSCDDAWTIAAADLWRSFVHSREDGPPLLRSLEPDELLEAAQDDLINYRFFRYTGEDIPADLNAAFALVLARYFFPPRYVWLRGRFIDMAVVPEVRVDGKVIYRTHMSNGQRVSVAAMPPVPSPPPTAATDSQLPPRRDMVCRLDVNKLEPGLYESRVSHGGQEMFSEAGFATIRDAISYVSFDDGPVYAVEVAYEGLVVGTYPPEALPVAAEAIAKRAVSTLSALRAAG